jgi:hypothetical protein
MTEQPRGVPGYLEPPGDAVSAGERERVEATQFGDVTAVPGPRGAPNGRFSDAPSGGWPAAPERGKGHAGSGAPPRSLSSCFR